MPGYAHSPHSSSGIGGSVEGTPNTLFTAYSPNEIGHQAKSFVDGTVPSGATRTTPSDPFVTTATDSTSTRLSALAPTFEPCRGEASSPKTNSQTAYLGAAALPKAVRKFEAKFQILKEDIGLNASAIKAVFQDQVKFGVFTTDTNTSRCIQVLNIHDANAPDEAVFCRVSAAIKTIGEPNFRGTERIVERPSAAFLRYSNCNEAQKVYSLLKTDFPEYMIKFISPAEFVKGSGTPTKSVCSSHEGQIVLTATWDEACGGPQDKQAFEERLRSLLCVKGPIIAWDKFPARPGVFSILVEFEDTSAALQALKDVDGTTLPNGQRSILLSVALYTPDVSVSPHGVRVLSTPTRKSAQDAEIQEIFERMSLEHDRAAAAAAASNRRALGNPMLIGIVAPVPGNDYMGDGKVYRYGTHQPQRVIQHGPHQQRGAFQHGLHQQRIGPQQDPYHSQGGSRHLHDQNCNRYGCWFHLHRHDQRCAQEGCWFHHHNDHCLRNGCWFHEHDDRCFHLGCWNQPGYDDRFRNHITRPINQQRIKEHQTYVDIEEIKRGTDVRTTVMLRNIPNKVDQATLKRILDETNHGRYDFMYLRIDFSNNCNVGYAFINFSDPYDIVTFCQARANKKWSQFKSDKIAEVSYANIQGRDCLIQKFRNSSVMLEPAHYRPKLYFTIFDEDTKAGEEEPFPAADNRSKLKRSCENAENVGLFAPSAGQHLRDQQRNRRSQWDRGTTLADREEFGFGGGHHHYY